MAAESSGRVRVLFLNTAKQPPIGAGPWLHAQVIRCLDPSRFDVHVAAWSHGSDRSPMWRLVEPVAGARLHAVDLGPERLGAALRGTWAERRQAVVELTRAVRSVLRLARVVRRERIDVVHTDERPRDAALAVLLARLSGARAIVHMHVDYGDWMSALLKWSLPRADVVACVSAFVAESVQRSPYERGRTHVILNAIEPSSWAAGRAADADTVRAELGVPAEAPMLIIVCRLIQDKGVDIMIRVVAALAAGHPAVRLVVVGQEQFAGYRRELEELAASLGVGDRVLFTGRREDVPRLMAAADLFTMPSVREPFGLVFLEAMASGLPVVAARSGGVPEFVDERTGVLAPPDDVPAIAEAVAALLDDPERRARLGAAGPGVVRTAYSSQRMADDCADLYVRLAGRPSRSAP